MFNSVRGTITAKSSERVCIETGGIEWDIAVSENTSAALPAVGSEAKVFLWLYHREDAVRLFGFFAERERSAFLELQKVEGIGSKAAMKILSGITADELAAALQAADLSRLEKISGIGKKTAQKMLLSLQGKLTLDAVPSTPRAADASPWADVISALVSMGYDRRRCEEIVPALAAKTDSAASKEERENNIFRMALLELSS